MDPTPVEVEGVREVGPDTVAVDLATPEGFHARPGQFVQFRLEVDGEPVVRHYSISSPVVDETLEITVEIDPQGTLSPRLAALAPGDVVEIDGPFGRVFYDDEDDVVAVGAGPGIGPATAVAERAVRDGGTASVLVHGDDLVHGERLAGLAAGSATVVFVRDPDRLEGALALVLGDRSAGAQVFAYGFADFVERVPASLEAAGLDPAAAKIENFG